MFGCTDTACVLGDQTNIPGGCYLGLRALKCDKEHNSVIFWNDRKLTVGNLFECLMIFIFKQL